MSLEETHIRLAGEIHRYFNKNEENNNAWSIFKIAQLRQAFLLGSFTPDIFAYFKKTEMSSSFIHDGIVENGENVPTNEWVVQCLDQCIAEFKEGKRDSAEKSLMILLGVLTHIATDKIVHPMVYSLSGYDSNASTEDHDKLIYLHWLIEVIMDKLLLANEDGEVISIVDTAWGDDLFENVEIVAQSIGVLPEDYKKAFESLLEYFKLFDDQMAYLSYINLVREKKIPLAHITPFADHVDPLMEGVFPEGLIKYRHPVTGDELEMTLESFVEDATSLSIDLIKVALEYYHKGINGDLTTEDRENISIRIPPYNLSTGSTDGTGKESMKSQLGGNKSVIGDYISRLIADGSPDILDLFVNH